MTGTSAPHPGLLSQPNTGERSRLDQTIEALSAAQSALDQTADLLATALHQLAAIPKTKEN